MTKPTIGQPLFYWDKLKLVTYGTVTKVGRKYFKCGNSTFCLENWRSKSGYYRVMSLEGALLSMASALLHTDSHVILRNVSLDNVKAKLDLIEDLTDLLEEAVQNDLKKIGG